MKIRNLFLCLMIMGLLWLYPSIASADFAPSLLSKPMQESSFPNAVDGRLTGYWIQMGSHWDDSNPAVAYSPNSDQYLVVQERDNPYDNQRTITGSFIDPAVGDQIDESTFNLAEGTHHMANPDVVYDPINDRFLVVWEEYDCFDLGWAKFCADVIKGQLVYGSYQSDSSQFAGETFTIASQISTDATISDLHDPAVAFNADDGQYMVIFNQKLTTDVDYQDIFGQMVYAHTSTPTIPGNIAGFLIKDYATYKSYDLDLAWSDAAAATFFAVWEREKDDGSRSIPGYYFYDTYQDGDIQAINSWTIAPVNNGDYPLINDCTTPSVAYDMNTGAYVVVFEYDETTLTNSLQNPDFVFDQTIYGQRVHRVSQPDTFRFDDKYAFPIEIRLDAENSMHSDPVITNAGAGMADTLVIYKTTDYNLSEGSNFVYLFARNLVGDAVFDRFLVRGAPVNNQIWPPDVACLGMDCLVVWQESCVDNCIANDAFDIHGQLLDNLDSIFFDESHNEQNTLSAIRAQEIVDDQGWGQPDWYYFGDLVDALDAEYLFYRNTNAPLTFEMLEGYGGVILSVPREPLTSSEINALKKYVASGGGLMLLADCGFDGNYIYPGLTDAYDFAFDPYCISAAGNDYIGDISAKSFANYALLDGVFNFDLNWGISLAFWGDSFWLVGTPDDVWQDVNWNLTYDPGIDITGNSLAVALGYETDCGRVIAVSDNSFQDSGFEGRGNKVLMRALLNWVTDGTSCKVQEELAIYIPLVLR